MNGYLSWLPWRKWIISPKYVQHMVASAAESDPDDKKATLALMESDRVEHDPTQASTASKVGAAVAVVGIGYVAHKKFAT